MTLSKEIEAALERWETFKDQWPHTQPGENAFDIGDDLARLLRAALVAKQAKNEARVWPD